MSLTTCCLKVTHHVIFICVWEGHNLDDGSKGMLFACNLKFCATFVDAIDILEFPIEATRGSLGEKNIDIVLEMLGQDTMSWPCRPPKFV